MVGPTVVDLAGKRPDARSAADVGVKMPAGLPSTGPGGGASGGDMDVTRCAAGDMDCVDRGSDTSSDTYDSVSVEKGSESSW